MNFFMRLSENDEEEMELIKKNNLLLFTWTVRNHFWELILLNIRFVICCIPIFTIGSAIVALEKSTYEVLKCEMSDITSMFKSEFKLGVRKYSKISLFSVLTSMLLIIAQSMYSAMASGSLLLTTMSVFVLFLLLVFWGVMMYVFKLLAIVELPFDDIIKNSILLLKSTKKQMLKIIILVCIPTYLLLNLAPMSIPFFVFFQFSYNTLITTVLTKKVLEEKVFISEDTENLRKI